MGLKKYFNGLRGKNVFAADINLVLEEFSRTFLEGIVEKYQLHNLFFYLILFITRTIRSYEDIKNYNLKDIITIEPSRPF